MVVQTIVKVPWNSIDEMNTLDIGAIMQGNFAVLFMSFMAFWKFVLPLRRYVLSILTSKESNPNNESSMKIESAPLKYSEISGSTYTKINEFNAATGMSEGIPGWNKLYFEIENSPPKYSANERSIAITGSRRLKNCFSISQANMNRIG